MSKRLTDEQLRALADRSYLEIMGDMAREILALRSRVAPEPEVRAREPYEAFGSWFIMSEGYLPDRFKTYEEAEAALLARGPLKRISDLKAKP
jgi:hypothetical protein